MTEFVVADLKGESVLKEPGSINGESFVIKNLEDCSVYLLDYTSEVEVSNCVNCNIFIGPVDGPAIFDGCTGSRVSVACQQFQAKNCSDCEIGLYCATQPSINSCSNVRFNCWMGAYPSLTSHFLAANLDPKQNNWNKVYDGSAEEGDSPNFTLVDAASYWEVPIEGGGPCENPVPTPDGRVYQGVSAAPTAIDIATAAAFPEEAFASPPAPSEPLSADMFASAPAANGTSDFMAAAAVEEDSPGLLAMREKQRQRLKEQEELEATRKQQLKTSAQEFLNKFYERRNEAKEARLRENREKDGPDAAQAAVAGDTPWDKVLGLIDFQFTRPNGTDLTRYKNILYTAKNKNITVT